MNVQTTKLKVIAASVGAGALIAGGALTAATTSWAEPAEPSTPGPVPTEEATTGATTIETTAPTTPTTSSAAPEVTGPAPLPPEEEGLPG
jgi:hypothetical protein